MPSPPIWIKMIITSLPNQEKYVPVSTTTSPVTHEVEVAVNSASIKRRLLPSALDIGSIKSSEPAENKHRKGKSYNLTTGQIAG